MARRGLERLVLVLALVILAALVAWLARTPGRPATTPRFELEPATPGARGAGAAPTALPTATERAVAGAPESPPAPSDSTAHETPGARAAGDAAGERVFELAVCFDQGLNPAVLAVDGCRLERPATGGHVAQDPRVDLAWRRKDATCWVWGTPPGIAAGEYVATCDLRILGQAASRSIAVEVAEAGLSSATLALDSGAGLAATLIGATPGDRVRMRFDPGDDDTLVEVGDVTVGADGTVGLHALPEGRYWLNRDGGLPFSMQVPSGDGEAITLPTASLAGRVVHLDGGDPGQINVRVARRGESARETRSALTRSERDGSFTVRDLEAGTYDLFADSPSGARGSLDGVYVAEGEALGGVEVAVTAGGDLRLEVRGADGQLLPGAAVYAEDDRGFFFALGPRDPAGTFGAERMGAGHYRVLAAAAELGIVDDDLVIEAAVTNHASLTLPALGEALEITTTAPGGAAVSALVTITREGRRWPDVSATFVPTAGACTTDRNGRLLTAPYPAGTYLVSAEHASGRAQVEVTVDLSTTRRSVRLELESPR